MTDSLRAYQIAKRGNSLRVMAEAVRWDKRGARALQPAHCPNKTAERHLSPREPWMRKSGRFKLAKILEPAYRA